MEKSGIPCVTINTDAFKTSTRFVAKSLGLPDIKMVTVPHPLTTLTEKRLEKLGEDVWEEVRDAFLKE